MNADQLKAYRQQRIRERAARAGIDSFDSAKFESELRQSDADGVTVNLTLHQVDVFGLITQVQVAASHPALNTPAREPSIELARRLQNECFDSGSEIWKAIELGWPVDME
jgi:hypothetical protein